MADDGPVRLHALIKGRVQGVGFRYYVEERASFLGITGCETYGTRRLRWLQKVHSPRSKAC